ncbi:oxidoreductase [Rhodococcus sp. BP-149]|nr:oxidoreductase [Rhodococcus sp. BP-288]MBY6694858.1 oxidoreductase [Rhodococcus sp. BP-188]MBY6696704.1 oxidoreductase [Rhodococcus sp. BP-285]MBY6703360.1 oxidoreductase [Rhodococcus sp. BP-283]MBY6708683.1 oxidoreductase [Rhodococcus sp. BP-241]MBY6710686.1 oxidoreductase [Rhodococcus sp. BP-160]MBY6715166.1 oxidoreductase [Rhodococcus sp. BP-110]MBY6721168.1 oxidoreductase [Rhodococcus sp. BP-142]MBY6724855.1 oxidoreductase [Rhodococcus sp. BP-149]MBY6730369.1 oxidoreductase [Rhodoco
MVPEATTASADTIKVDVLDRRAVAQDVVELTLGGRGPLPTWTPGSHIDIHLPADLVRQYSLCGDPDDAEVYRVAILRESDGRGGSLHLHDSVAKNSILEISPPRNHFSLARAERYVFVAGGIGITPLLPMMRAADAQGADWTLDYCGRTRCAMAYADVLEPDPRVRLAAADEGGRLDVEAVLAAPGQDTLVYCCGPSRLLDAVEAVTSTWPEGSIHTERFTPREIDEPVLPFDVQLARSGMSLHVPADRAMIDVMEDAGVVVPASCRQGTCGTCETMVLAGAPQHRDSVLTRAEQDAGDCMMVCVSRANGTSLLLDI